MREKTMKSTIKCIVSCVAPKRMFLVSMPTLILHYHHHHHHHCYYHNRINANTHVPQFQANFYWPMYKATKNREKVI